MPSYTPTTWSNGNVPDEDDANRWETGIDEAHGHFDTLASHAFLASKAASPAQTISGVTKVTFEEVAYDPASLYDDVTDNDFTAPAAGIYLVTASVQVFASSPGGDERINMYVYKNGSLHIFADTYSVPATAAVDIYQDLKCSIPLLLAANDTIDIRVNDNGESWSVNYGNDLRTRFSVTRLS